MQYWGGKLSAAQLQVAGWVRSLQRSLQGGLDLVWGAAEKKQEEEIEGEDVEEKFHRALSPLRNFTRRSRKSLSRFSIRSRPPPQRSNKTCFVQVSTYSNEDDRDPDVLIDNEPDRQNDACEQTTEHTSEDESSRTIPDNVPEVSSEDPDTTDFPREIELPPFPENSTRLLDTSAQRARADLGKSRRRARPSRSLRTGLSQKKTQNWRICDSSENTEASSKQTEIDSEDEQPKQKMARSPPSSSQRVPMFPGLSPAALLAQIKKKTSPGGPGGQDETEEDETREEKEGQIEEETPSPFQPSRSARSPAHLAGAARVLPPLSGADEGAASCPSWLKELKSKKRMNQQDDEV